MLKSFFLAQASSDDRDEVNQVWRRQPFPSAFDSAAIDSRQDLYRRLCDLIWDPAGFGLDVPASPPPTVRDRSRVRFVVSLRQLVDAGLLTPGCALVGSHRGSDYRAELTLDARIRLDSQEEFDSLSPAAMTVLGRQSWNGWMFWHVANADGSLTRLDDIRKAALEQGFLEA